MRGDRNHLRLVGDAPRLSIVDVDVDAANVFAVRADNVRPGQVCEVLHVGVFALSHRVVVPEGNTTVTVPTFALKKGTYEVSVRIDGAVHPVGDTEAVHIGEVRAEPKSATSAGKPSYPNIRIAATGPRSMDRVRGRHVVVPSR